MYMRDQIRHRIKAAGRTLSDALKERFDFAKRVLKEGLGIEVESLEPIARGYNNKVYLLKIFPSSSPTAPPRALAPGCVPFPERTPEYLIFRTVRHVSQVPAARKLLNAVWMVEGKLPGVPMDELWQTADTAARLGMLEALADVLAKLKSMPVPSGSKYRFGGLTYDSDDKIVLGPTCLGYDEGPFTTAKEHYRAWIVGQWEDCKKNARADGWKVDGLHERIEKFINDGLESTMSCLDDCEPVFIHADFGFLNTLVSETAPHVITGLLDYEWSHFGPPSDEYFVRYSQVACPTS
ncbi:hypothetical protein B0H10DRAFT_2022548 [Mycena sp. CBHHK59/15]|nr:hypothetical protein B0H10DRAFT_2022548 [Mycena sp. CBHHK59/15]